MEQEYSVEKMDFEVVKQKIIKANEILHLYHEKTEKLNKAAQAFKSLKANHEKATQQINTLRLSNDHLTERLEKLKPQNVQAEIELNNVKADYARLEEKYQAHMIETQLHITDLEAKIHKCTCKDELSPTKKRTPEAQVKELKQVVADMQQKERELTLQVNRLKKRNVTLEGRGLSKKSELNEELRVVKEKLAATETSMKEQNNLHMGLLKNKKNEVESLINQITQLQLGQQRLKMVEEECNLLRKEVRAKEAKNVNGFIKTEDVKSVKYVAKSNISTQTSLEYFPCSFEPSKSKICNKTLTFLENTKVTQYDQEEEQECSLSGIFREMILPMSLLSPIRLSGTTDTPLSLLGDFSDPMDTTTMNDKEDVVKVQQNLPNIVITPPTPNDTTAQYYGKLYSTENQQKIEESNLEHAKTCMSEKSSHNDHTALENTVINIVAKMVEEDKIKINSDTDMPRVEAVRVHSENGSDKACMIQNEKSVLNCDLPNNVESVTVNNDKGVNQSEDKTSHILFSETQFEGHDKTPGAVGPGCSKIETEAVTPVDKPPDKAHIKTVPIKNRPRKFWVPYIVPFIKPKKKTICRQPANDKDTILWAIQTLKRNNINFTISNHSGQLGSHNQPKVMVRQLLKEIKDQSKTPNRFKKPPNLLRHRRYKTRGKTNSEFLSETESELEKLFLSENILERNKRLLEVAKEQAAGSDSEILGDSGLVTASSKLDSNSSICSDNEVTLKASRQKIDPFDLYKSPFCPTLLSPMSPSVKGSPPENAKSNIKSSVCQKITFDGLTDGGRFTVISYNKKLTELKDARKQELGKAMDLVTSKVIVKPETVKHMKASSAACQTKIETPVSDQKSSNLVMTVYRKQGELLTSTGKTNMVNSWDESLRSQNQNNLEELLNLENKKCQRNTGRELISAKKNLKSEKQQIDVQNAIEYKPTEVRHSRELTNTSKSIQDFFIQNVEGTELASQNIQKYSESKNNTQMSKILGTSTASTQDVSGIVENTQSQENIKTLNASPLRRKSSGLSSLESDEDNVTQNGKINCKPFQRSSIEFQLGTKASLSKQASQADFEHFKLLHKARESSGQTRPAIRTKGKSAMKILSKEFVSDSEPESSILEILDVPEEPKSKATQYKDLFGDSESDMEVTTEARRDPPKKEIGISQDVVICKGTTSNLKTKDVQICRKTQQKSIHLPEPRYQTRSKGRLKILSKDDSKTNHKKLESTNLEKSFQQKRELCGDIQDNMEIRPAAKRTRVAYAKDILKTEKSCSQIDRENFSVPKSNVKTKKEIVLKNATAPVDLISNVIQGMIKTGAKMQSKKAAVPQLPSVSKQVQKAALCHKKVDTPEPLEDTYKDCPKSPDPVAVEEEFSFRPPKLIPWTKPQKFPPSKIITLMQKLIVYSNEEVMLEEVVMEFAFQEIDHMVRIVMNKLCLDVYDKPDNSLAPSPPMTNVQRILFGFLLKLEKNTHPGIIKKFMRSVELQVLNKRTCELPSILPITRVYTALCKMNRNMSRIRRFLGDCFYFCGNFALPITFVVITMWPDVLPMNEELSKYPLARVIVQLIYTKNCDETGFNLLPLRDLFARYYHYPTEQWDAGDVFKDILVDYVQNPSVRLSEFTLMLFLKYQPTKFLQEKIDENFFPLYKAIPESNPNLKAILIMTICNITCRLFRHDLAQMKIILGVRNWAENQRNVETHPVVLQAVTLLLQRLPRRPRATAKTRLIKKNETTGIRTDSDKLKSIEPEISEVVVAENNRAKVDPLINKITILKDNESDDSASDLKLSSDCEDSCNDLEF